MNLQTKYPFIAHVSGNGVDTYGILQNVTSQTIWLFDLQLVTELNLYLDLGNRWWYESDRTLPIDMVLEEFRSFHYALRGIPNKGATITAPYNICLAEFAKKRIKKRLIRIEA